VPLNKNLNTFRRCYATNQQIMANPVIISSSKVPVASKWCLVSTLFSMQRTKPDTIQSKLCAIFIRSWGMRWGYRLCFDLPPIIFNRSSNQRMRLILIMYILTILTSDRFKCNHYNAVSVTANAKFDPVTNMWPSRVSSHWFRYSLI